jgi:hypothetical protein
MFIATLFTTEALEATQMPYNWWVDQKIIVCMHNAVLISHKE